MKKNNYNYNAKELRGEFKSLTKKTDVTPEEINDLERKILFKIKNSPNQSFSFKVLYAELMTYKENYGRSNMYYLMALEESHKAHWIYYCMSKNLVKLNREREALGYLMTFNRGYGKHESRCDLNTLICLLENLLYDKKIDIKYTDKMFSKEITGDNILYSYEKIISLINDDKLTDVLLFIDSLKQKQGYNSLKGDLEFIEIIINNIIKRRNYDNSLGLYDSYAQIEEKMNNEEYEEVIALLNKIVETDINMKMSVFKALYSLINKGYIKECKNILSKINTEKNMNMISHLNNIIDDIENDIREDECYINEQKAYEEKNPELALEYALEGYKKTSNPNYAYLVGALSYDLNMDEDAVKYLEIAVKHNGKHYIKSLKKLYALMDRNGEYERAVKYFDQYSRVQFIYSAKDPLKPFFSCCFNNVVEVIDEDLYNEIADYIQFGYLDIAEEMIKRLQNKKDKTNSEKQTLKLINNNKKLLLMKSKKADE